MEGKAMRRPGGDWSIERIVKAEHYQTVLYEIDMLRFSCGRLVAPPSETVEADVWAYLETFLGHYRNLLDFFGKENHKTMNPRYRDITLFRPETVWSAESGLAGKMPSEKELDSMRARGKVLWNEYENPKKRDDTISRFLQHCTEYRTAPKKWYPLEMMSKIKDLLEAFERSFPEFRPATNSRPLDRERFLGGSGASTASGSR
jgi:hypothetical protein